MPRWVRKAENGEGPIIRVTIARCERDNPYGHSWVRSVFFIESRKQTQEAGMGQNARERGRTSLEWERCGSSDGAVVAGSSWPPGFGKPAIADDPAARRSHSSHRRTEMR